MDPTTQLWLKYNRASQDVQRAARGLVDASIAAILGNMVNAVVANPPARQANVSIDEVLARVLREG